MGGGGEGVGWEGLCGGGGEKVGTKESEVRGGRLEDKRSVGSRGGDEGNGDGRGIGLGGREEVEREIKRREAKGEESEGV